MSVDIAFFVTEALKKMGREDLMVGGHRLDNHSTITISLSNMPNINIAYIDDYPVVWTTFGVIENNVLSQLSELLLMASLTRNSDLFHLGQPALCQTDNGLELRATFTEIGLHDIDSFIRALEYFYDCMYNIYGLLNG